MQPTTAQPTNAATAGADYTQATGTLTFKPSDTTKTVSVSVLDDRDHEDDETFILTQSGASGAGAWIENTTANGTIMETDPAPQKELARFQRTASVRTVESFNTRDALNAQGFRLAASGDQGFIDHG